MQNYSETLNIATQSPLASFLSTFLQVITAVSMWKILEDRREKGWKALIPFYSTIVFGRTFKEEGLAKKIVLFTILLIIAMTVGVVGIAAESIVGPIFFVIMLIIAIYTIILQFKFYSRFVKFHDEQSWWTIVWVFLNPLAALYFAFIRKNYNIPGVTKVE